MFPHCRRRAQQDVGPTVRLPWEVRRRVAEGRSRERAWPHLPRPQERREMTNPRERFMELVRAIVSGDTKRASRLIARSPRLVHERATVGASRDIAEQYFFEEIRHYLYGGDTALHMAAAGYKCGIAQELIDRGADCSAKIRRGAEPLH